MHEREDAWLRSPQSRYLRPDFERYLRPDRERYLKPQAQDDPPRHVRYAPATIAREIEEVREQRAMLADILREKQELAALKVKLAFLRSVRLLFKARSPSNFDPRRSHYDPNQPRVPKGNPDGGQWTDTGGGREGWVQVAGPYQGGGGRRSSGPRPQTATRDIVRLDLANARYEKVIGEIRTRGDLAWQPAATSFTEPGSVRGDALHAEARLQQAVDRLYQLRSSIGANFGPPLEPALRPSIGRTQARVFDPPAEISFYRTIWNVPDRSGRPSWPYDNSTVAVSEVDGELVFGVNSSAPGYREVDRLAVPDVRDALVRKYPDVFKSENLGWAPNDFLFHAEATLLLRAAGSRGGTLSGRTMSVYVDREVCRRSCWPGLPLLGLELGNPTITFVNTQTGEHSTLKNGRWD